MRPAKLLSIHVAEADKHHQQPLYLALVERALHEGLAGATAQRGIAGFGTSRRLHTSHLIELANDLPVVVQIVDEADKLERFMPALRELAPHALVTLQDVQAF